MVETAHELEVVEELDFTVPCDHETCDLEADYLLLLSCPYCPYEEEFLICDHHWVLISQSHTKASCRDCIFYGELSDFLVSRIPII